MLQGSGYVVTGNKYISIGARVPGRIDAYLVDESEEVVAGQPLVRLDRRDYEAALERAGAALELARANESLARTLAEHLGQINPLPSVPSSINGPKRIGDLCKECGQATFVYEEGCKKCLSCGFNEC